jgi:hypothetical protein
VHEQAEVEGSGLLRQHMTLLELVCCPRLMPANEPWFGCMRTSYWVALSVAVLLQFSYALAQPLGGGKCQGLADVATFKMVALMPSSSCYTWYIEQLCCFELAHHWTALWPHTIETGTAVVCGNGGW